MRFPSLKTLIPMLLVLGLLLLYWWSSRDAQLEWVIKGETQGTSYNIKFLHDQQTNWKPEIDSILVEFSKCLSTYDSTSEISDFNRGNCIAFSRPYFYPMLSQSNQVYEMSGGAFDPTLMPLIQVWSKAKKTGSLPDSSLIDSLMQYVGWTNVRFSPDSLCATKSGVKINFNAIAPGYSTDLILEFLMKKGIENAMVEIGGEVRCMGLNLKGKAWTIGIDDPLIAEKGGQYMKASIQVINRALATSGNYRNFFELNGRKYGHTLNPKTGYPAMQNILSATVLAPNAALADGLATACMVLGTEGAIPLIESKAGIDAFLVYSTEQGEVKSYYTPALKGLLDETKTE